MVRALRLVVWWQPFTWFGWLGIALATLAVRTLAIPEYDLVADILGMSFLGLAATLLFAAFWVRIRLARSLRAELRFDSARALSKRPVDAGILLYGAGLPPLFTLRVSREFEHDGPDSPVHVVRGRAVDDGRRPLVDSVIFPHRGYWAVKSLHIELRDDFGVTAFKWSVSVESGVEVSAPTLNVRPLPIVAASSRAGDELHLSRERSGDLFDIKPYDPSDGVKRILWKTYAKSGQLVVRRPEPAVIPEGEVAIYLVAEPEDDHVAGALLGYLEQLEEGRIVVLFGTDGFGGLKSHPYAHDSSRPQGSTPLFTSVPQEMLGAMNQSVWSDVAGSGKGFGRYLQALTDASRQVSQVIVFGPDHGSWFNEVAQTASRFHVRLSVALVPRTIDPAVAAEQRLAEAAERRMAGRVRASLARALPASLRTGDGRRRDPAALNAFYGTIRTTGSEVIQVQSQDGGV